MHVNFVAHIWVTSCFHSKKMFYENSLNLLKMFSTLENIFCAFLAKNIFVKVLIPLRGVLKIVQDL